jgi:hypothetical protein
MWRIKENVPTAVQAVGLQEYFCFCYQPLLILQWVSYHCVFEDNLCFLTLEILPEELSSNLLINQTALEDLMKCLEVYTLRENLHLN